jgi:hypothetical protein
MCKSETVRRKKSARKMFFCDCVWCRSRMLYVRLWSNLFVVKINLTSYCVHVVCEIVMNVGKNWFKMNFFPPSVFAWTQTWEIIYLWTYRQSCSAIIISVQKWISYTCAIKKVKLFLCNKAFEMIFKWFHQKTFSIYVKEVKVDYQILIKSFFYWLSLMFIKCHGNKCANNVTKLNGFVN